MIIIVGILITSEANTNTGESAHLVSELAEGAQTLNPVHLITLYLDQCLTSSLQHRLRNRSHIGFDIVGTKN